MEMQHPIICSLHMGIHMKEYLNDKLSLAIYMTQCQSKKILQDKDFDYIEEIIQQQKLMK